MASEPTLPGMEIWVPEGEYKDTPLNVEERSEIWRIVNEEGNTQWSYVAARYRKPYYGSLKGAKAALHYFPMGSRIQKGSVTWSELD